MEERKEKFKKDVKQGFKEAFTLFGIFIFISLIQLFTKEKIECTDVLMNIALSAFIEGKLDKEE